MPHTHARTHITALCFWLYLPPKDRNSNRECLWTLRYLDWGEQRRDCTFHLRLYNNTGWVYHKIWNNYSILVHNNHIPWNNHMSWSSHTTPSCSCMSNTPIHNSRNPSNSRIHGIHNQHKCIHSHYIGNFRSLRYYNQVRNNCNHHSRHNPHSLHHNHRSRHQNRNHPFCETTTLKRQPCKIKNLLILGARKCYFTPRESILPTDWRTRSNNNRVFSLCKPRNF